MKDLIISLQGICLFAIALALIELLLGPVPENDPWIALKLLARLGIPFLIATAFVAFKEDPLFKKNS